MPWNLKKLSAIDSTPRIAKSDKELNRNKHSSSAFSLFLVNFYWSIVALRCCVSLYCTVKRISYTYRISILIG